MRVLSFLVLGSLAVLGSASSITTEASHSPLQKVIQMLNDMMAKGKTEKQDEKARFATFNQFCEDTTAEKKRVIAKETEQAAKSEADAAKADSDVDALAKDMAVLNSNIGSWTNDKNTATALRAQAHDEFKKTHSTITESLTSTEQALESVSGGGKADPSSLLMLEKNVPHKFFASFMQVEPAAAALMQDEIEWGTPEAKSFEGSAGGIAEVVQQLLVKFEEEKTAAEKQEARMVYNHKMQVQDLTGSISQATHEHELKASEKAQRQADSAEAKGNLADSNSVLNEDTRFLADLTAECQTKTADFQKRQVMRQGEIEAIEKAIEVMSSGEVAGGSKHLTLVQKEGVSLAQRLGAPGNPTQRAVARFLADCASKTNSRALSLLAMQAAESPFAKVEKMVKDMITRLMDEANEAAEHKSWCDYEMSTNEMTRNTKTELIASLKASIEQLSADITKLAQTITNIDSEIVNLDGEVAQATEERKNEKSKNMATISDGKVAQQATMQAMSILKEYYGKASNQVDFAKADGPIDYDPRALAILDKADGGAALVQSSGPASPQMESGKYTGMENGGVLGMLEIIESDFASLISQTESSEAEGKRVHEQYMEDAAQDKAVKNVELKHAQRTKVEKESDLNSTKKDLKVAGQELYSATTYFEKLKPSCVDAGVSFDDRTERRKEEIESLQEALKILSQDDIA